MRQTDRRVWHPSPRAKENAPFLAPLPRGLFRALLSPRRPPSHSPLNVTASRPSFLPPTRQPASHSDWPRYMLSCLLRTTPAFTSLALLSTSSSSFVFARRSFAVTFPPRTGAALLASPAAEPHSYMPAERRQRHSDQQGGSGTLGLVCSFVSRRRRLDVVWEKSLSSTSLEPIWGHVPTRSHPLGRYGSYMKFGFLTTGLRRARETPGGLKSSSLTSVFHSSLVFPPPQSNGINSHRPSLVLGLPQPRPIPPRQQPSALVNLLLFQPLLSRLARPRLVLH
jgi:hypothetical protein